MTFQQDVTNLMRDKNFVRNITDVKDENGEPILSPIQQMVDQRVRDLLPAFCFQEGFKRDYEAIRHATFSQEQSVAKNALTSLGLKIMDGERTPEELIRRQLLNSDQAKGPHSAQLRALLDFANVHASNGKHISSGNAVLGYSVPDRSREILF